MKMSELINNEVELRTALKAAHRSKTNKFDFSRKALKSFYRQFNMSLLIVDETPFSWIVLTKRFGRQSISKDYSIRVGMFVQYVDTWYLKTCLASKTADGKKQLPSLLLPLSKAPSRTR